MVVVVVEVVVIAVTVTRLLVLIGILLSVWQKSMQVYFFLLLPVDYFGD